MEIEVLEKHICFTSSETIREIAAPLFDHFNVRGFFFNRYYHSGVKTIFPLSTDPRILTAYFKNIGVINSPQVLPLDHKYMIVRDWVRKIQNSEVREHFDEQIRYQYEIGVDNDFALIRRHEHYIDIFELQTHVSDRHALERFINHLDMLDHFIDYFYDRAQPILALAEIHKITIPDANTPMKESFEPIVIDVNRFLAETKIKRFYCKDLFGHNVVLSAREFECMSMLCTGATAQQIGDAFHLSKRTVEMHISSMKSKLGCRTRNELLAFLNKLSIPNVV